MEISMGYITATVDLMPHGFNVSAWLTTVDFYMSEKAHYPFQSIYVGDFCTWIIHSNIELTGKMSAMIGEQADRMCSENQKRNERRKIANRS